MTGDAAGWLTVRKRALERAVAFAREDGVCETLEGPVPYASGDAIVTGERGERWPVSKARFTRRYRPCGETRAGEDGRYLSAASEVLARRLEEHTEVAVCGGTLVGEAGDWVIDYGDGSRGVVRGDIFADTYDVVGPAR